MEHRATTLYGLRILVTRPAYQATNLVSRLYETGATPVLFPVTNIIPTINHSTVNTALQQYEQASSFIFTSSNAVTNGVLAIKQANKPWPPAQPVFAIGPATGQLLEKANCQNVIMPDADFCSEGLLAKAELQHLTNNIILIFGGTNPRPFLATQLQQRGAKVIHAACYMRQPTNIQLDIEQQVALLNQIDVIVCTSLETLCNLIHLFDEKIYNLLFNKEFVLINLSMEITLKNLGYIKSPIIADNPTDNSIISSLTRWYEEHHHG